MAKIQSKNSVVAKALNACARNGGIDDFKVGDVVGLKIMDGGRRDYVIYEVLPDSYRLCYADDFGVGCERVKKWPSDEFVDKHRRIKVPTNACGTARNATFGSVEDAERYSEQAVKAAKSRVFGEMNTLKDVVRALKGYPDSKTVQKNLVTLEWALEEIKKAAQTLS